MMTQLVRYDVFISYSHFDYLDQNNQPLPGSPVGELINYLDSHHISYWIDKKGMYASAQFTGLIADNIRSSGKMIFVSSKASNASKYTLGEVLLAFDEDKPIIPFRIDDTPYADNLKIPLLPLHRIDYYLNPGNAFNELLRAIGKTIENTYTGTFHNGHEYVDLGLPSGLLWATCNVGASKPSEYGDYFAWGETKPKDCYEWINTAFRRKGTQWNTVKFWELVFNRKSGDLERMYKLMEEYDAAYFNWGGAWRTPTTEEWKELKVNCYSEWIVECGVNGRKFTSRTNQDSCIFLPAAGMRNGVPLVDAYKYGLYWSANLDEPGSKCADSCCIEADGIRIHSEYRCFGLSVRPVLSSSSPMNGH